MAKRKTHRIWRGGAAPSSNPMSFLFGQTRRSFRWPKSEKKPRFFSDGHLRPLAACVRPRRASAIRALCGARRALHNGPGTVAKLEPTEPGEVHNYGLTTTHLRPDCNAGRWSSLSWCRRQRRVRRWSTHCSMQVCLPAHPNHHPNPNITHHLMRWRRCSLALLSCLPASRTRRETPCRAASSHGQNSCGSSGGSGRRRRARSERECMVVYAVYGMLCALLALCDALLTVEGGNSTLQVPS